MANKQSQLEIIGNAERANELMRNTYGENNVYDFTHRDAISDGDPLGKGTGNGLGPALNIPPKKGTHATSTVMGKTMDTSVGGGQYDIEGTKGVIGAFQGDAGREYLLNGGLNVYGPANEYGVNSVSITDTIVGQYVVK